MIPVSAKPDHGCEPRPKKTGGPVKAPDIVRISSVAPLNGGSTRNDPPNCGMPEMPTARIATPMMVPQTFTRPGLMVVDPGNAPASAGNRNSSPTEACPKRSLEASSTPARAARVPDATNLPTTHLRVEMPFSTPVSAPRAMTMTTAKGQGSRN